MNDGPSMSDELLREVRALRADIQALPERIAVVLAQQVGAWVKKLEREMRWVWVVIVIWALCDWAYNKLLK